jgi:hypothetical protein
MPRSLLRIEQPLLRKRRWLAPIDKSKPGLFNPFSLEHDPRKVRARQRKALALVIMLKQRMAVPRPQKTGSRIANKATKGGN